MSGIRCVSDLSKIGERNYSLESWIVIVWNVSCLLPITPCGLGRRDGWHFRLEFVSNNWLTPHPPPLTPHPPPLTPHPSPLTPHPPPPTPHPSPPTPYPPPLTPGIDLPCCELAYVAIWRVFEVWTQELANFLEWPTKICRVKAALERHFCQNSTYTSFLLNLSWERWTGSLI